MAQSTIDRLIVNSPCEEPAHHWRYDRTMRLFDLVPGRRASAAARVSHEAEVEFHGRQGQPFAHRIPAKLRRRDCRLHRAVLDSPS